MGVKRCSVTYSLPVLNIVRVRKTATWIITALALFVKPCYLRFQIHDELRKGINIVTTVNCVEVCSYISLAYIFV